MQYLITDMAIPLVCLCLSHIGIWWNG